jgi:hypothetical protein
MIPKKPALGPRSEGVNRLSDKLKRKAKTKERVNLRPFRFMQGNAVFALRAYGVPFGKPLDVTIPQYAYLTKRGQQPIAVIVVQAELGKGLKIFGVRDLNGKTATAKESELQLLGTHSPD